jgi:phosphoribosyl 1,2-cyclic phosphate phosphodiesterase
MEVTFLGTGTSHGIPVIGCDCPVCTSADPHNNRMRSSLLIRHRGLSWVIDTGQEFRLQAIRAGLQQLDAVFYTHDHADHMFGIDDLRIFSCRRSLPVYGAQETLLQIRKRFAYIFASPIPGGGVPSLELIPIDEHGLSIDGLQIQPVPIYHGTRLINGYRFGPMAYLTDCSGIPESSLPLLEGLEMLVVGALREREHPTHFSIGQAVDMIQRIAPVQGYLTHMCHEIDHESLSGRLPPNIAPAYDGLCVNLTLEE